MGIDVGFNHRGDRRYRSLLSGEWRNGDNLEQMLIDGMQSAEEEILVAVKNFPYRGLPRVLLPQPAEG